MTQILPAANTATLPTSSSASQNLINQLITEGLATNSAKWSDQDLLEYRRLLKVLIDSCLVKPAGSKLSKLEYEHAELTITILQRQIVSKSKLFAGADNSFHKWIISRALQAAGGFARDVTSTSLVVRMFEALLSVGRALSTEQSDTQANNSESKTRTAGLLQELAQFATGESQLLGLRADIF